MKINYKIFWVFLFIIAVGICTGSFFETGMTDGSKSGFFDALISFFHVAEAGGGDGENFSSENFLSALGSFLPVLLIGYVSAFLPILLPLIPLYIFTRGVSVGFSAAAILEAFGLKGTTFLSRSCRRISYSCRFSAFSVYFPFKPALRRFPICFQAVEDPLLHAAPEKLCSPIYESTPYFILQGVL